MAVDVPHHAVFGDDDVDHAAPRQRQRTLLHELAAPLFVEVARRDVDLFCPRDDVHRAAHAWDPYLGDHPVCEASLAVDQMCIRDSRH